MNKPAQSDGHTRASRQPTHLLQTPDTFVRTPLPELTRGLAIIHASPALGAGFLWMTVELDAGGSLAPSANSRFLYLLEGEATLTGPGLDQLITPDYYAFAPSSTSISFTAQSTVRAVIIDKAYEPSANLAPPAFFSGHEATAPPEPLSGDPAIQVRALMPPGFAADFAVNTMTYAPGAALSQVEIHYMEHGLLMLQGSGPYRLGDSTHPTTAGDFIWMAPYCPQWFQADPAGPAKYLIYKNFNRLPPL